MDMLVGDIYILKLRAMLSSGFPLDARDFHTHTHTICAMETPLNKNDIDPVNVDSPVNTG